MKPHEIAALPKHYYDTLKQYYFIVHPPKENSDLDETFGEHRVVDFDKVSARRKSLMKEDWSREVQKGDPV